MGADTEATAEEGIRKAGVAPSAEEPTTAAAKPPVAAGIAAGTGATAALAAGRGKEAPSTTLGAPTPVRTSMEDQASMRMHEIADAANPYESTPLSPRVSKPQSKNKVKNWFMTRFPRRTNQGQKKSTSSPSAQKEVSRGKEKGFVGGQALTGAGANNSTPSVGAGSRQAVAKAGKNKEAYPAAEPTTTMPKEVMAGTTGEAHPIHEPTTATSKEAMAEKAQETNAVPEPTATTSKQAEGPISSPIAPEDHDEENRVGRSAQRDSEVSAPSAEDDEAPAVERKETAEEEDKAPTGERKETTDKEEESREARDNFDEGLAPPPTFPAQKSSSPAREARFTEVID